MLVFRENRVAVSTHLLVRTLAEKLCAPDPDARLDALLRAGELECALADVGSPAAARLASVTDSLADSLVTGGDPGLPTGALDQIDLPRTLKVSPPEGFAYYALHPMSYAALASQLCHGAPAIAVLGIRSIGTTLGAIVAAACKRRGIPVERISVRPAGHPFDRTTRFTAEQLLWLNRQERTGASFFVVDEGPGLSGSSFLSVGEALVRAGVEHSRISFLCSHMPNRELLRASDGAQRWSRFRAFAVENFCHPAPDGAADLSAGKWRDLVFPHAARWPASWLHMERVKFLSPDRKLLYKFEGLGRFGTEVCDRAHALADAGFGPPPQSLRDGFAAYAWIEGVRGDALKISESLLNRLAEYCAFRATKFCVPNVGSDPSLIEMLRCNLGEGFGAVPDFDDAALACETPVIVDGRMQPHEWLTAESGVWLKIDASSHGDDHFYPGPTDIAWDLAGAIVEWQMDQQASEFFLARYRRLAGDNPASRLPAFLMAYSAFRLGYSKMAADNVDHEPERARLMRDYERYRRFLRSRLTHKNASQMANSGAA